MISLRILVLVMDAILSMCIGLVVASVLGLAIVAWRFVFAPIAPIGRLTPDWTIELSAESYQPMLGLLDERDFHFLSLQPGFKPEMAAVLRRQRYQIFMSYLRNLRADFERTAAVLTCMLAGSNRDRSDLASALAFARLAFAWGFIRARLRAWAWQAGYGSKFQDRELLHLLDAIGNAIRALIPPPSPQPWTALDDWGPGSN